METVRGKSRKREAMLAALRAATEHPTAGETARITLSSRRTRS